jgi:site-specific recombinase XerD
MQFTDLLKQYRLHLKVLNRSQKTITWYNEILTRFFKFLDSNYIMKPLGEISAEDLEAYIKYRNTTKRWPNNPYISEKNKGKLSPYSIQGDIRAIKAFWSWLLSNGYVEKNAFAKFPLPKVPKTVVSTLTIEQMQLLLNTIKTDNAIGFRNYCILLLLIDTGMRISEVTGIEIINLSLTQCFVKITGKGQKERIVPFSQVTRKAMLKYINNYRPEICNYNTPYLFPARDGNHVSVNTIQQAIRRLAKKVGLQDAKCHPHIFRHTFATTFLAKGGNPLILREILGHESIQTTQKYVHPQVENLQKQQWKYSPLVDVLGK